MTGSFPVESDDPLLLQLRHRAFSVTQRFQKFLIMFAQLWRWQRMRRFRVAVVEWKFDRTDGWPIFPVDLYLHAHVLDLRVFEHFLQVVNWRVRHIMGF